MTRRIALAAAALAVVLTAPAAAAPAKKPKLATCGANQVMGGEWRSYGRDLANTRHQAREKVLSVADAPFLTPAWSFSTVKAGGEGDITGTPVVAGQCLYTATTEGWVFALNADTGKLVWKKKLPYGGGVNGTPTHAFGRIYVSATRLQKGKGCPKGDPCKGPYVVAYDAKTGKVRFATRSIDRQAGSDVYGSPVVYPNPSRPAPKVMKQRGVVMVGISGGSAELGDEADRHAFQGSMVFLNAASGKVLVKRWTIRKPDKDPAKPKDDFAGAGIWSTPAVDAKAGVAYAGTANPFRPQAEHKHANAVVKYDVDRRSKRFGQIIGHYKGTIDEYIPAFSEMPCYDIPNNYPPYYPQGVGQCGDIDLDFGAAPNLMKDAKGNTLVGDGQKSGVYHVFDGKTMKPVWTQVVGPPGALGGVVGSTAYDGKSVFGPITVPGYLWSISADDGAHEWVGPVADGVHWGNPVAVANGAVYTVDLAGFLDVFDARTGALLAKRPLALGGPQGVTASWAGVAVARHMVYASVGIRGLPEGYVIAYRPGSVTDIPNDGQETVGGGGDTGGGGEAEPGDGQGDGGGDGGGGGAPASVVAGPGAYATSYATPAVVTGVGGPVSFVNFDIAQHDVVATDKGADGEPLFKSKLINFNETAPVEGLDKVKAGQTYGFFCSLHPGMRGQLVVR